jgi:hypothetical protein
VTRAKISQYSATANDNTDVNGINIAENCPPSSMNNMGREIMAALKRFQTGSDGDPVTIGGQLAVTGTTTTSPAIVAAGDTNTGIFFPAADTIAFAEGGAEAMRIDSSGNVGIGTSSPDTRLHIDGATNTTVRVTSTTNTDFRGFGIGAAEADTTEYASLKMNIDTGELRLTSGNNTYGGFETFYTNGSERMRIDPSGNVGIGTTSPDYRLVLNGTGDTRLGIRVGDTLVGAFQATSSEFKMFASGASVPITLQTNGVERARITSGGYFKASNTGDYVNSTGNYHELRTSESDARYLITSASNASYASDGQLSRINRAANSAYSFLVCESDSGNDIEFRLRGDGNGYADGTWNNNGADYAEYFESANGQALTLGATVVLDGNKVREATEQDPASAVIGVVRPKEPSKASMVVGNTAWNKWANKYLTDDFDRYIMEDHDVVEWEEQVLEKKATEAIEAVVDEDGNEVSPAIPAQEATYKTIKHSYESHNIPEGITVPEYATVKTHDDKGNKFQHYKLNPAWDKDSEYTPREQRPEWNIIGLVGQVKVLKGQPTNDRWVKMRDVSETVEEWFVR